MPQIILTDEQVNLLTKAQGPVDVVDGQGRPVTSMRVLDAFDVQALERYRRNRDNPQPGIPSERVQTFFRKLHAIADREGIDETKVKELLRRSWERAGEPL
jgi:hypothetical protein